MAELSSANRQKIEDLRSLIHERNKAGLMTFLESGWDINQLFLNNVPVKPRDKLPCDQIAAIHLAVDEGWLEGLQLLLDAGADVNLRDYCDGEDLSGEKKTWLFNSPPLKLMFTPLMRAIWFWPRPQSLEIVKFLLENGANPTLACPNTNHTAITVAVKCTNLPVIDLLLSQYNVDLTGMVYMETGAKTDILSFACDTILPGALSECRIYLGQPRQFCAHTFYEKQKPKQAGDSSDYFLFEGFKLIKDLVSNGAIVNANSFNVLDNLRFDSTPLFDHKILDFLFKNGVDINDVKDRCTIFPRAVSQYSHTNYIRWLIRHGANTHLSHRGIFISSLVARNYELYELMLHAGLNTSHRDRDVLQQILLKQNARPVSFGGIEESNWTDLTEKSKCSMKKFTTWNFDQTMQSKMQESDLMEFSDDTLHIYPTVNLWKYKNFHRYMFLCRIGLPETNEAVKLSTREEEQIRRILTILSQPPSLEWRCRQWIRQNLVSLSPSVIKSLQLPSTLKRYILCHEL